jgi:hypothetical protein
VSVLLSGVKTTLKKLADRPELLWHVVRDVDSSNLIAEAPEKREKKKVRNAKSESHSDGCMIDAVYRSCQGVAEKRIISSSRSARNSLGTHPPSANTR